MSPPQRTFSGRAGSRRSLKLLVAVRIGYPTVVIVLTGSSYAGCPALPTYTTTKGKAYKKLSSMEYIDALTKMLTQRPVVRRPRGWTPPTPGLVHDRDTVHRSKDVAAFLAGRQVTVHLLPPRSPDLGPLDYAVFANVKQEMRRQMEGAAHLSWDAACAWLIQRLRNLDASAMIAQLRKRLHACVAAQGAHFEHMPQRMWVPKAGK